MSLWCDVEPAYALHGVASEVDLLLEMPERTLARILVVPRLATFGLSRHSRVFTGEPMTHVIRWVLEANGLADGMDFELRLGREPPVEAHVCQYRESDLAFVERLLEHLGYFYYFEHDGSAEKLVITDDVGGLPRSRAEAVRYHPGGEGDVTAEASFRRFSERKVSRPRTVTVVDHDYANPRAPLLGTETALPNGSGEERVHAEDRVFDETAARARAKVRAEELLALQTTMHAVGTVSHLRSGYVFGVREHALSHLDGDYVCVRLEHHANLAARTPEVERATGLAGEEVYVATVTAIPAGKPLRPARRTPKPRIAGLLTGVVDGEVGGDYAELDAEGRYLVRLHLDERTDLPDGKHSTRLRMMQPHAGAPEGMHFPLRKGTEVLVSFLDGDPDRPVLAGAVPDGHNPSPVRKPNHTHHVVHSGGGNRLDFEDQRGSQWITFSSPTENTFLHLGAHVGGAPSPRSIHVVLHTRGDGLFDFGSNQDVEVGGELVEKVKGAVKETYSATQSSLVLGNQTTTVAALCDETYQSTQDTLTLGQVTESYQVDQATFVDACPRDEVFLASQTTTVSGGGLTQQFDGDHTRAVLGHASSTLASYDRHVTGDAHFLYGATVTRLWGPNRATFKSLDLTIPGGVVEVHALHQLNTPTHTTVSIVKLTLGATKVEVAFTWMGGTILKLEACGVAIAGTSFKMEATGAARVVNGGVFGMTVDELEVKGGQHIKLAAVIIKI